MMSDSQKELASTMLFIMHEHIEDVFIVPCTHKKTGVKSVAITLASENDEGEPILYPIGEIWNGEYDPFEDFEFDTTCDCEDCVADGCNLNFVSEDKTDSLSIWNRLCLVFCSIWPFSRKKK